MTDQETQDMAQKAFEYPFGSGFEFDPVVDVEAIVESDPTAWDLSDVSRLAIEVKQRGSVLGSMLVD